MKRITAALALFIGLLFSNMSHAQVEGKDIIDWSFEKQIPNELGFNGSFIGVHNDALIVAGGANFPDDPVWEGGKKVWYDSIYILEDGGDWSTQQIKLPRPLAYGVSISTTKGVLCIGGSNADGIYKEVFFLKWDRSIGKVEIESLPPSPIPLAYMAGDRIGEIVYLIGGQENSDGASTKNFLSFDMTPDLIGGSYQWKVLDKFPGKPRNNPVVVSQSNGYEDCLYVFSGMNHNPNASAALEMLYDVYEYHPLQNKWEKKMPVPGNGTPKVNGGFIGAAPALKMGDSHILIFGGAGGKKQPLAERLEITRRINELKGIEGLQREKAESTIASLNEEGEKLIQETSFSRTIWAYHTITDTWSKRGELPAPTQVVTKALQWQGNIIIPGGEIRPVFVPIKF